MSREDEARAYVPEMDALIGRVFPVLDKGFIRVVDYMGSDQAITQAARVSYGAGTKSVSEDRDLIRYLMRHRHTGPFEQCELKLQVRVPMDAWRQWIRHRTASVNEYSTRYSIAIEDTQETLPSEWRIQSSANKQGSGGFLPEDVGMELSSVETDLHVRARAVYEGRIAAGVAREQARKDLPLSTYTEAFWKVDLHNLLHFLSLRMDSHAQKEIRDYAAIIGEEIVAKWVPYTWEAFVDYKLQAMSFSRQEATLLKALLVREDIPDVDTYNAGVNLRGREYAEFKAKLSTLGLCVVSTPKVRSSSEESAS
jgi:thymidylate synthase (FAD)